MQKDNKQNLRKINLRVLLLVTAVFVFISAQAYAVTSGALLWKDIHGTNNSDSGNAIAIDANNNVYVTGQSASDYATIRYDASGNKKWVKRYNGAANEFDQAQAIGIDKNGNIYVTGTSLSASSDDIVTIKYDNLGNRKWLKRYNSANNGDDSPVALTVSANNYIYVLGRTRSSSNGFDFVLIKYDAAGNRKWLRRYNGTAKGNDWPSGIVIDSKGAVYVAGSVTGSSGWDSGDDYVVIKYSTTGDRKWVRQYNGNGNYFDFASGIAVDGNNNIYVTGSSMQTTEWGSEDIVTVKYDSAGKQKWVKQYNGPAKSGDRGTAVKADSNNNIYVTGSSEGGSTGDDYAIIKYDANGNQKWVKRYNGNGNNDSPSAMAIDRYNNVYITGITQSGVSWDSVNYATVKYDRYGNRKWVKTFNGSGKRADTAMGIAINSNNNAFVTGTSFSGNTKGFDIVTLRYAP